MIFKDNYFFLSNFYPCQIITNIDDKCITFQSVEAAFQAHKNTGLAEKFVHLQPLEAKKIGEKIPLTTPDWDTYQLFVMAKLLHLKFSNKVLFNNLIEIKEDIVEDNYWGDTFWGRCKGKGRNFLGKMLMYIRDNDNNLSKLIEYITSDLLEEIKC